MNITQAKTRLKKLGFEFLPGKSKWGSMEAESYDVGKDHFKPRFRDVYIGQCVDGYYITSHIKGMMRRYRHRYEFDTDVGNIFAGGRTLDEVVAKFVHNFQNKIYNRGQRESEIGLCMTTD